VPPGSIPTGSPSAADSYSSANNNDNGSGSPLNVGAIAGGVVGSLAVICGSAVVVIWLLRRNNNNDKNKEKNGSKAEGVNGGGGVTEIDGPYYSKQLADQRQHGNPNQYYGADRGAGWGPRELPAVVAVAVSEDAGYTRSPVELPAQYHVR